MIKKKKTIFQSNNLSMLAKYLEVTPATIYGWKKNNTKKFDLVKSGWESKCKVENA